MINRRRGKFITIEGIDTAGKSTQAEKLAEKLKIDGYKVKLIHFPMYESPVGTFIKSVLNKEVFINDKALQAIYVADQINAQEMISWHLNNGYIVIADRYDLSTAVYNASKTKNSDGFEYIYSYLQKDFIRPDMTIIMNIPGEEVANRKEDLDYFEADKGTMNFASMLFEILANTDLEDGRITPLINATNDIKVNEKLIYDFAKTIL